MKFRKFFSALLLALFSLQTLHVTALADEGMWTFNNVPRAEIKKKYGFDVTDEWLNKVRLASVRFNNGGSGSFVSPNGLVLTNYHILAAIAGEARARERRRKARRSRRGSIRRAPCRDVRHRSGLDESDRPAFGRRHAVSRRP